MSNEETIMNKLDRLERLTLLGVKRVLEIEDAALLTGFTTGHLYRLTSERKIPHYKKNRKVYFDRQELEEWMKERKIPTDDEVNMRATTYTATHKSLSV